MESLPSASQGIQTGPPVCGHQACAHAAQRSNSLRNTGKVLGRNGSQDLSLFLGALT